MKAQIFFVLAALSFSGCTSYSFHSNLDPDNVSAYFRPSEVEVMSRSDLALYHTKSLGTVSGLSCQTDERDFIANEADARTDGRLKARELGGNAVIFNKCIKLEKTPSCLKSVTCYGEVFIKGDRIK